MKIITTGNKTLDAENIPCRCTFCECQFVFRESEAFSYVEDRRDGDYYRVACPECSVLNSVDVRLKGSAVPQPEKP